MTENRYSPTYRQNEARTIARWIEAGDSGIIVGLSGSGRSNVLKFLCQNPEALSRHFTNPQQTVIPVPVDLNDMAAFNISTLYRTILRGFYESRQKFPPSVQSSITDIYQSYWRDQDPFVVQSTLRELLFGLMELQVRVVLVIVRFDYFCEGQATPEMLNTLRGLRDSFKTTLCYLVALRYDLTYLPDPFILRDMLDLLDSHTCWVGSLQKEDALNLIRRETRTLTKKLTHTEEQFLLDLTGHYPALLKEVCRWWRSTSEKPPLRQLVEPLMSYPSLQHRLKALWASLTQEEQYALSELEKTTRRHNTSKSDAVLSRTYKNLIEQYQLLLKKLVDKGVCRQINGYWQINGHLLTQYVAQVKERGQGRIWYDENADQFWQGAKNLELTPQQHAALSYFFRYPRQPLSKSDLIMAIWPTEWEEVDEARLYQLIRQIRQKIEPNTAHPVYLVNWRARPEGGYQFFPEGRANFNQDENGL